MSELHNELSGRVEGNVLQVGSILGDVNIGSSDPHTAVVPRQLPSDIRRFVARGSELRALSAAPNPGGTLAGGVTISAVAGMGGIGKTALAVRWCHQVRNRYVDGDLYVDLQGFGPGIPLNPAAVLHGFLRALGVPGREIPADLEQRSALYRSLLHERRVLVLLDNAASTDQIRPLLPGSPSSLVLVTSRSSLSGLVAQHDAHRIELGALPSGASLSLLRGLIGSARVKADPSSTSALLQICSGLPLAIRIAGERLAARPHLSVSEALHELSAILDSDEGDTVAVQTVFSWSYRALSAVNARVFRLLGLYPIQTIPLDGAAVFLGLPIGDARRAMESLADLHLIERTSANHYRFHDLVREYARRQALRDDTEAERMDASASLLGWYLSQTERFGLVLSDSLPNVSGAPTTNLPTWTQAVQWQDEQREHFEVMAREAFSQGLDVITSGLAVQNGRVSPDGQTVPEQVPESLLKGLSAARRLGNETAEAWIQWNLGGALQMFWNFREAGDHFASALGLFREGHDRLGEAWTLHALSQMYDLAEEHPRMLDLSLQAVAIFHDEGNAKAEAAALLQLGRVYDLLARHTAALYCFCRALNTYHRLGMRRGESSAYYALAGVYHGRGYYDDSIRCYEWSLDLARSSGDRESEAWILYYIGCNHRDAKRDPEALHWFTLAMEVFRGNGDQWGRAWLTLDIAHVHLRLEECDLACDLAASSLDIFRALRDVQGEGAALTSLGEANGHRCDFEQAHAFHSQAVAAARRIGSQHSESWALALDGDTYAKQQRLGEAIDCYQRALALRTRDVDRRHEARILRKLGDAHRENGDLESARQAYESTLAILEQAGDQRVHSLRAELSL